MNFYAHHIGDYLSATAHLSWTEDCAYRRLLDAYYTREAALPVDVAACCRLVRATSKDERAAVGIVLREFFVETPDGWQHSRCEREIERAREAGEGGELRRENEKERQRRHRDRRKVLFAQLREHGIVPPFDTSSSSLQRLLDDAVSRGGGVTDNAPVTRDITQTQRLTNPNPNPNTKLASLAASAPAPEPSPAVRLAIEARQHGLQVTGSDPRLIAAAEQGVTPETLRDVIAECARRKGSPPPIGYVLATLQGWAADAGRLSVVGAAAPARGGVTDADIARLQAKLEAEAQGATDAAA